MLNCLTLRHGFRIVLLALRGRQAGERSQALQGAGVRCEVKDDGTQGAPADDADFVTPGGQALQEYFTIKTDNGSIGVRQQNASARC